MKIKRTGEPKTRVIGEERGFPLAISGRTDMPFIVGYTECDVIIRHFCETRLEAEQLAKLVSSRLTEAEHRFWETGNWGINKRPVQPQTIRIEPRQNA
jgi:hypothetical protein